MHWNVGTEYIRHTVHQRITRRKVDRMIDGWDELVRKWIATRIEMKYNCIHHGSHICFKNLPCWNIFKGNYPWIKVSSALITSTSSTTPWGLSHCTRLFWDNTDADGDLLKHSSLSLDCSGSPCRCPREGQRSLAKKSNQVMGQMWSMWSTLAEAVEAKQFPCFFGLDTISPGQAISKQRMEMAKVLFVKLCASIQLIKAAPLKLLQARKMTWALKTRRNCRRSCRCLSCQLHQNLWALWVKKPYCTIELCGNKKRIERDSLLSPYAKFYHVVDWELQDGRLLNDTIYIHIFIYVCIYIFTLPGAIRALGAGVIILDN